MTTTIAGAIRWDYFYQGPGGGGATSTALQELEALETAGFRSRAPLHFASSGTNTGQWGDTQATFDAEITAAVSAGLSYWCFFRQSIGSFVWDANGCHGLTYYKASTLKSQIKWCSMVDPQNLLGSTGNFSTRVADIVTDFQDTQYQKVLTNRPLLYIYYTSASLGTNWGGSMTNFAAFITALRAATVAVGLGTPYIVVTTIDPTVRTGMGADAATAYLVPQGYTLQTPWATYEATVQAYWATLAGAGPTVPVCMTGYDQRPRFTRPVFRGSIKPYFGLNQYVVAPTTSELTAHLTAAVNYIAANPAICPASTLLIYAWNECSENGTGLMPTLGDPTGSRCTAAGTALIGH